MNLLKNKKGVRFENVLIGFLVLTLFVVGGTLMMVDLNNNYGYDGVNISTDKYGDIYNTTEDMFGIANDADDKILHGDITDGAAEDATIGGAYSTVRLIGGVYGLFKGISSAIQTTIGIPEIIIEIAIIAFTIIISFSIVYLIFRFIPK